MQLPCLLCSTFSFSFFLPSCYQHRVIEWLWQGSERTRSHDGRNDEKERESLSVEKELKQPQLTKEDVMKENVRSWTKDGMSGVGGSLEPK